MMLVAIAIAYGILAWLVFRLLIKPSTLRRTANRIVARIMELGLFVDEPHTVFRAQLALARENLRLLRQIAIPCLIMAALFAVIYPWLQLRYDNPNPDIVTLPSGRELPAGIVAETPPVHVLRTNEVGWRIHPQPTHPYWLLWFLAISTASGVAPALRQSRR